MALSRLAAVRSVPDTDRRRPSGSTLAPSERGKNSYQEPNSARWRWTSSGYQSERVVSFRSGNWASVRVTSAVKAPPRRSTGVPFPPRRVLATLRYSARAAPAWSAASVSVPSARLVGSDAVTVRVSPALAAAEGLLAAPDEPD